MSCLRLSALGGGWSAGGGGGHQLLPPSFLSPLAGEAGFFSYFCSCLRPMMVMSVMLPLSKHVGIRWVLQVVAGVGHASLFVRRLVAGSCRALSVVWGGNMSSSLSPNDSGLGSLSNLGGRDSVIPACLNGHDTGYAPFQGLAGWSVSRCGLHFRR